MADRWKVSAEFLPTWHEDAIKSIGNDARIPELAWLMLDDVKQLGSEDSVELWEKQFTALRELAGQAENQYTRRGCAIPFSQIKAWLWITKEAGGEGNNDSEAFRLILSEEVTEGIAKLAKSSNDELARAAEKVVKSDESLSDGPQQLLKLLAESKHEAARLSGQQIFKSFVPKLTNEQIEAWQPICYFMTEELPLREDFSMPYHGSLRNGYHDLPSELKVPSGFSFDKSSGSWICEGKGKVDYARLPFENYVVEVELVIEKIAGDVKIALGSEDSTQVRFKPDKDVIRARLVRRLGGRFNWKGSLSLIHI